MRGGGGDRLDPSGHAVSDVEPQRNARLRRLHSPSKFARARVRRAVAAA
jgi:hypothetical protein